MRRCLSTNDDDGPLHEYLLTDLSPIHSTMLSFKLAKLDFARKLFLSGGSAVLNAIFA